MKRFIIFDNCCKTLDRYTIINKETGDVFGCGENPDTSAGAGVLIGNCAVEEFVTDAQQDPAWLGKEVDISRLPLKVQHYIARLASNGGAGVPSKGNVVYLSRVRGTASK